MEHHMNAFNRILAATAFAFAALSSAAFAGKPVNINTASATEIADALDGVGAAKAAAIVEFRQKNGGFKSADQLTEVKGIGLKTVQKNAANIKLSAAAPAK
jgi:competence protein ComEA